MIPPDPRYLISTERHEAERAAFACWLRRPRPAPVSTLSALPASHPFWRCALASGAMRAQPAPGRRRAWPWLLALAAAALSLRAVL